MIKLAPYLIVITLVVGTFFYGVHIGKEREIANQLKSDIKAVNSREEIEHEAKNLERDAIIDSLFNNDWLRPEQ